MILCTCSHTLGGFLRVYVCTVHICISIHIESLTLHIGVNDMGVLHGTGVPLKSKTKDYTCIDLYTEMVWGDDNVPSTLSGRQEKAKARLVFLHYECMVKEEEKQLLANRCADAGLPGPVCVCVRVCVRSMSVRCAVCPLSFDVAPMSLAVAPLRLCRLCSQIMPKARRSFNWENRRSDFPLLQPIPIFLDLAVSTALLLPTPYISPLFLSPFPSRS
jgi:hypothetical protein